MYPGGQEDIIDGLTILTTAKILLYELDREWRRIANLFGITPTQMRVIMNLPATGAISHANLSRRMNCPKSTVTESVNGLVSRNLAEKTMDPDDERGILISFSPRGKELRGQMVKEIVQSQVLSTVFALKPEEKKLLLMLMGEIAKRLLGSGFIERASLDMSWQEIPVEK